jgi:hypothetical protein
VQEARDGGLDCCWSIIIIIISSSSSSSSSDEDDDDNNNNASVCVCVCVCLGDRRGAVVSGRAAGVWQTGSGHMEAVGQSSLGCP